jgi:hypothetical protein
MKRLPLMALIVLLAGCGTESVIEPEWPDITQENKPWTRWWWQGSAVEKQELTSALEEFEKAGIGGVEITPIYGVAGYEDQFIDFLSPEWVEMFEHTLQEGGRLNLGVDIATGTGWPFGGPMVGEAEAAKYIAYETYELQHGEQLSEPIKYMQQPYVAALGNRMYGVESASTLEPGERVEIDDVNDPVSDNENLQSMALEQIQFEKELPLVTLVAYSEAGEVIDLTSKVDVDSDLDWKAPEGNWTLYALFSGLHGKMVERAAPGGEGLAVDHFDEEAITNYFQYFDKAFSDTDISGLRSFFNDSYEVDDARGEANWTPEFFDEFEERRGYNLREHLPALFNNGPEDENRGVLSDYRETISDLLLDKFTVQWKNWANNHDAHIRNQAHGSPANLLDLYAASDIPETEGTDIFRSKMASSATHVSGKQLTAAEAATWLDEHFLSTLSDVKRSIDRFWLGGVNHIVYHGTNYSPSGEDWPGWLFYAAVHFNPHNSFWDHFAAFNDYVARVQSFLQSGNHANDVLLYFPIYDRWSEPGSGLLEHFDGAIDDQFEGTAFLEAADRMWERGYGFDFISDRQIKKVQISERQIQTGENTYQTILVPASNYIPLSTFESIIELAEEGATVLFYRNLPSDVSGWIALEANRERYQQAVDDLGFSASGTEEVQEVQVGNGRILLGNNLDHLMDQASVVRESLTDLGLEYVRRSHEQGNTYFVTNWGDHLIDEWVPLGVSAQSAALFNPMTKEKGFAKVRLGSEQTPEVYLQLEPGESVVVQTFENGSRDATYPYLNLQGAGEPEKLNGTWLVEFVDGGPELPEPVEIDSLTSWTEFGGEAVENFSGRAKYTLSFNTPRGDGNGWILDLGEVEQSARVKLNGQDLGTLTGPVFKVYIGRNLMDENSELEIEVANLMANRIAYMDRKQIPWKKFYNINMSAWQAENRNEYGIFDASGWSPRRSGLIGPVTLTPVNNMD